MYNMNKLFIEYPKQKLDVCYDGVDSYLNLIINHFDNGYVFVQFPYGTSKISEAVKKVLKLRNEYDTLYLVICMILDQFVTEHCKDEKGEFEYIILPEKLRNKIIKIDDYPCIYICTNDSYYDIYAGKMLYNGLKKKRPLTYFQIKNHKTYVLL